MAIKPTEQKHVQKTSFKVSADAEKTSSGESQNEGSLILTSFQHLLVFTVLFETSFQLQSQTSKELLLVQNEACTLPGELLIRFFFSFFFYHVLVIQPY